MFRSSIFTRSALSSPRLLETYIRAQYLPALQSDPDIERTDKIIARKLVRRLASMRQEQPRDTRRYLLA